MHDDVLDAHTRKAARETAKRGQLHGLAWSCIADNKTAQCNGISAQVASQPRV
jgi:hypothetical protein